MRDLPYLASFCFIFIAFQILLYFYTMKDKVILGAEIFSLICSLLQVISLFAMIYLHGIAITTNEASSFYLNMVPQVGLRRIINTSRLGTLFT